MTWRKTKKPGVMVRHRDDCPALADKRCRCDARYRAEVWDGTLRRPVKGPVVANIDEAESWRVDYRRGLVRAPAPVAERVTFRELAGRFIVGADRGDIPASDGNRYSDRTLRSYRSVLDKHVLPAYGGADATTLEAKHWQRLVDDLRALGLKRNTINNVLMPVRAIYRWACAPTRGLLPANTVHGLDLPARDEVARMNIALPARAATLLEPLPPLDRVAYALAFYAGLRRREIRPMTWDWIDFGTNIITVRESKTEAGIGRKIPIVAPLRALLLQWRLAYGGAEAWRLVVPGERSGGQLSADALLKRCAKLWLGLGLEPIGLHDARHTFASWCIEAGINFKKISTYMGHTSIQITLDRYGHLLAGSEEESAALLNEYLERKAA